MQHRIVDWHVSKAQIWTELVTFYEEFVANDNYQVHWAHPAQQDGRNSPAGVFGWVDGMQHDLAQLHRIFYTTRFGRKLDTLGYVRFSDRRIYAEHGLAGKQATLWLWGETLLVAFSDEPLAQYRLTYEPEWHYFREIAKCQLFDTKYHPPQMLLWEMGESDCLKVLGVPPSTPRRSRCMGCEQRGYSNGSVHNA